MVNQTKLSDHSVPTVTGNTFLNQKPLVDITIRDALNGHTTAYNSVIASRNMEEYKRAFYNLRRVVKEAKRRYRDKVESQFQQSDKLDHFYAHFKVNSTSANPQAHTAQVIAITVSEHDLRRAFKRVNTWKAAGPESNSRSVPMACTDQLAQLFTTIFILCPRSLTQPA